MGTGNKNSLWIMKGTIMFPHERLSRSSEEKFPHERRSRKWGNFSLLRLLSLEWGSMIVPWMTNGEFFLFPFFKMMVLTFLLDYWKLCKEHWVKICQKVVSLLVFTSETLEYRFWGRLFLCTWISLLKRACHRSK